MNFYISLEKRKKLQCLCNNTTDLHKNLHDDAERVSEVHGC